MRIIRNYDVGSYYPHLMTINGYTSRNIPDPKIFSDVLERRMQAKAAGDTATANALKLVVNTTYGASLNQYNDLYDPLMGRSVCISGQLYLFELANHLYRDIPDLRVVQVNTDGVMIEFDDSQIERVREITDEWQQRTGFELEEDKISKIIQKDVNNYIEVQDNGKAKLKGGYLVRGIAKAGAFNVNNSAIIVATAIKEYFVNGTPVETTIGECADVHQFQLIAKAGSMYEGVYHEVGGEMFPTQRVNRVYATKSTMYGTLYKKRPGADTYAKLGNLPEHCQIDNNNELTIDSVDINYYIDLAKHRIDEFKGIKPEKKGRKKMANITKINVYRKLANVREQFLAEHVKKTGKNPQFRSMYFELDDIVPVAMPLFHKEGLLPITSFTADVCSLTVYDMDDKDSQITFTIPMREWNGNNAVTPIQALGASVTYLRRYALALALDLVEADDMENGSLPVKTESKPVVTAAPAPAMKIPVSPEKREEVKIALTNPEGNATPLQISGLKKKLKELKDAGDPDTLNWIAGIAVETKSFTELTKERCEEIILEAAERLNK